MIFPVMYQFVRLLSAKDHELDHLPEYIRARFENCPENLVDRIELQADINWQSMQFSSCIRHLRVEWKMNEQQLQSFGSAVLKLKTLEHLDWKVSLVDSSEWYDILVQFVEKLPQIQSLKLTLPLNDIHLDDSGEIIDLANLKSLAIELDQYTGKQPDEQVPSNIIRLICGARNIESLALDIEVDFTLMEDLYLDWEAEDMFAAIFSHQFPRLRELSIGSYYQLTSVECFSDAPSGLRQFLQRHPLLEKVVLYMHGCQLEPDWSISPQDMEDIIPSIRHFAGPALMANTLVNSRLVSQLEVLQTTQLENIPDSNLSDLLQGPDILPLQVLSRLRGIGIYVERDVSCNNTENGILALAKLVPVVPGLEEIVFCTKQRPTQDNKASAFKLIFNIPDNSVSLFIQEDLLKTIAQLPHLRRLALPDWLLLLFDQLPGAHSFSERAKSLCPGIEIVGSFEFSPNITSAINEGLAGSMDTYRYPPP
ncbi:hypothetical protein RHS02_06808, partial [Rhizoctonia solani]